MKDSIARIACSSALHTRIEAGWTWVAFRGGGHAETRHSSVRPDRVKDVLNAGEWIKPGVDLSNSGSECDASELCLVLHDGEVIDRRPLCEESRRGPRLILLSYVHKQWICPYIVHASHVPILGWAAASIPTSRGTCSREYPKEKMLGKPETTRNIDCA